MMKAAIFAAALFAVSVEAKAKVSARSHAAALRGAVARAVPPQ